MNDEKNNSGPSNGLHFTGVHQLANEEVNTGETTSNRRRNPEQHFSSSATYNFTNVLSQQMVLSKDNNSPSFSSSPSMIPMANKGTGHHEIGRTGGFSTTPEFASSRYSAGSKFTSGAAFPQFVVCNLTQPTNNKGTSKNVENNFTPIPQFSYNNNNNQQQQQFFPFSSMEAPKSTVAFQPPQNQQQQMRFLVGTSSSSFNVPGAGASSPCPFVPLGRLNLMTSSTNVNRRKNSSSENTDSEIPNEKQGEKGKCVGGKVTAIIEKGEQPSGALEIAKNITNTVNNNNNNSKVVELSFAVVQCKTNVSIPFKPAPQNHRELRRAHRSHVSWLFGNLMFRGLPNWKFFDQRELGLALEIPRGPALVPPQEWCFLLESTVSFIASVPYIEGTRSSLGVYRRPDSQLSLCFPPNNARRNAKGGLSALCNAESGTAEVEEDCGLSSPLEEAAPPPDSGFGSQADSSCGGDSSVASSTSSPSEAAEEEDGECSSVISSGECSPEEIAIAGGDTGTLEDDEEFIELQQTEHEEAQHQMEEETDASFLDSRSLIDNKSCAAGLLASSDNTNNNRNSPAGNKMHHVTNNHHHHVTAAMNGGGGGRGGFQHHNYHYQSNNHNRGGGGGHGVVGGSPTPQLHKETTAATLPPPPQMPPPPAPPAPTGPSPPPQPPPPTIDFASISRMDVLSERIYDFYQNTAQSPQKLCHKLQLRDYLYHLIKPIYPMCGLYLIGSSLNGFGTNTSDMDLCLMISESDIDQRTVAVCVLQSVMQGVMNDPRIKEMHLIQAKVPILRLTFSPDSGGIVVDLNVNNSVAIRNTHLLSYYAQFDWRVCPLVLVVKEWAKRKGINDPSRASFTSYSLVLMIIHYLQCGVDPPVLPSLQKNYQQHFNTHSNIRKLVHSDELPKLKWTYDYRASLGELLIGFLEYYSRKFDFENDAISIRLGERVSRKLVAENTPAFNQHQWQYICIEEPFTFSNTAHAIYDQRAFQGIKRAFEDGFCELNTNRDLASFFGQQQQEKQTNSNSASNSSSSS